MSQVKAAVVGLGWWGKHIVRRMADSNALKLVAAVELNPAHETFAKENGLRFLTSLDQALADPEVEAVILCTPHAYHTEQIAAAAKAGKHVFCEKPLALNRAEAESSVNACRVAGVVLGIGHERRYEGAMEEIARLVRSGALGEILHLEANFSHDKLAEMPPGDWRRDPDHSPAAGMTAMGIHLTDGFLDLCGPIDEVYATTSHFRAHQPGGDVVSVHTRFASGATGYLNAILLTPLYIGITVFGSEGWAEARNQTHPDTPGPTDLTVQYRDGRRETSQYAWNDTVRANLEAFANRVATGASYRFTDAQMVGNIAVLEAIVRSVKTNLPVKVG